MNTFWLSTVKGKKTKERGKTKNKKFTLTQEDGKSKVKLTLEQAMKVKNLYSFFNLGARWGGWSTPRPGGFTRGKETRLGVPQRQSGWVWKILPPQRVGPRTV